MLIIEQRMKKPDPTYQELIATAQKLFSFEIADGNKINIFQELNAKNIPHLANILEHKECKITSLEYIETPDLKALCFNYCTTVPTNKITSLEIII